MTELKTTVLIKEDNDMSYRHEYLHRLRKYDTVFNSVYGMGIIIGFSLCGSDVYVCFTDGSRNVRSISYDCLELREPKQ